MTGGGMIRKVVLPNVARMLLSVGYVVFVFMVLVPQMDFHNGFNGFIVFESVLLGLYGVGLAIISIVEAYIKKWEQERSHYLYVKNTFAMFNKHYWNPDWNLRDFPEDLKEAKRLGIDKELTTDKACRLYLYGHDPKESRPPRPKFNENHTMIEVDGKWHFIPDKFYGRVMNEATVDQIVSEIMRSAE